MITTLGLGLVIVTLLVLFLLVLAIAHEYPYYSLFIAGLLVVAYFTGLLAQWIF